MERGCVVGLGCTLCLLIKKKGSCNSATALDSSIHYFPIRFSLRGAANVSCAGSLSFFHVELGGARDR